MLHKNAIPTELQGTLVTVDDSLVVDAGKESRKTAEYHIDEAARS